MPEGTINPKKTTKRLINWPEREDRPVLAIAMALAFFFWLLVKLSTAYRTDKAIALSFRLPEGKAFSIMPPGTITATVEGTGWALLFDYLRNPVLQLSLDVPASSDRFMLSGTRLRAEINSRLRNIQVLDMHHDDLELRLEAKNTSRVPVVVPQQLSFAEGYQLRSPPTLSPDSVTVTGPASSLARLRQVLTDTLRLSNLRQGVQKTLALQALAEGMYSSNSMVRVDIEVEQYTEQSYWIPIRVINCSDSVRIFPRTVLVNVQVGLSRYPELRAEDFVIVADFKDAYANKDDRNSVLLSLSKAPVGVRNIRFSPKSIEYYLIKQDN
jgi:hypothetical protein